MKTFDFFCQQIELNFSFLENEYGYNFFAKTDLGYLFKYSYIKKDNLVQIEYSQKNNSLTVNFFKQIFKFPPTTQDGDHSIGLGNIIFKKKKRRTFCPEDYEDYMPANIGFENSVKKVAALTIEFANDILAGKNWKGWLQ